MTVQNVAIFGTIRGYCNYSIVDMLCYEKKVCLKQEDV